MAATKLTIGLDMGNGTCTRKYICSNLKGADSHDVHDIGGPVMSKHRCTESRVQTFSPRCVSNGYYPRL